MEKSELKSLIIEYEAEKQYARNKIDDAEEMGNAQDAEIWEIIEDAFSDLAYNLKKLNK